MVDRESCSACQTKIPANYRKTDERAQSLRTRVRAVRKADRNLIARGWKIVEAAMRLFRHGQTAAAPVFAL